ncbi:hypothetical protein THRCLA_11470 [Thraustotheca clavata]|uniref:AB hydrolase-1 domain-containing protein n=1 Tax=Thraustotheca clavata TaxID=74557 RepID=A0A1V9Y7M0_9STRA|nr:hypothetical protein THRCLA_11470 [Thraustotheca clavata]
MEAHTIALPSKATASLSVHTRLWQSNELEGDEIDLTASVATALVVFLNGLMLPQNSWFPVVDKINDEMEKINLPSLSQVVFVTYDRYGQGETKDNDPLDAYAEDPSHGHDALDVVSDLNELVYIVAQLFALPGLPPLIFVANSIGCAVARLYAQVYPKRVHALLLADSIIASSHYGLIIPDPDTETIDQPGITPDMLRKARSALNALFHPDVGNAEGFSRRNLMKLLPHANAPKLLATALNGPFVTVLEHDPEVFLKESMRMPDVAPEIVTTYTNPFWHKYNEGLIEITGADRRKGPAIVEGAGHFIQAMQPHIVANETVDLIVKVLSHVN